MSPYHLKLNFGEEYLGQFPCLYFSFIRVSVPLYSVLDKAITVTIYRRDLNSTDSEGMYLFLQSMNSRSKVPKFIELDMKKKFTLRNINKFIESQDGENSEWACFIPLNRANNSMEILKSSLSKPLSANLVKVYKWKKWL